MYIIPGESKHEPGTVARKVSPCHGAPVRHHDDSDPKVNYHDETLTCSECGAELTAEELVDEEG